MLNSLLLPTHAMTSACCVFTEQAVSDAIEVVVTATAAQNPMVVGVGTGLYEGTLTGTFSCCEQSLGLLRVSPAQGLAGKSLLR